MKSSLTCTQPMTLFDLFATYVAARETSLRYRESLLRTVRKAKDSGLLEIRQLTPANVNAFLNSLTVGATTKSNIRRELLTLWRYAFEEGLTDAQPVRITRIRPKYSPPQAWSLPDLARLMACAENDMRAVGGTTDMRVCDLLPAWIGIAYDTGLRFGDVLSLHAGNIRNGCVCVTASKTGKPLVRRLSEKTEEAVHVLLKKSDDTSLFSWAMTRRRAIKVWRAFLDRHGFDGSSKWLRRSCATYVERKQPGAATRYLQHSHPALAPKHYLDETLFDIPDGPPPISG